VDQSKAQEITAYLRPNPDATLTLDQIDPFSINPYRPLGNTLPLVSGSYLHEREHKRELRRNSARGATAIASFQLEDQERTLLFNLRSAFVSILHAKEILRVAQDNLAYYDRVLEVNRTRQQAGDISEVDLGRLELQRVQYESDVQNAEVSLRTAKIQLLALLNDRTPLDQFDVNGKFDFSEQITPLEEFRAAALDARPDLKAACRRGNRTTIGSPSPMAPPIPRSVSISGAIRRSGVFRRQRHDSGAIFDRNQGEAAHGTGCARKRWSTAGAQVS
jgi:cobalt-zinc-cadmium efflux system outer membrane protein